MDRVNIPAIGAGNRSLLFYAALLFVFAVICATNLALSSVAPQLAEGVTIGLATCIVIALVRRWRVVVPDHEVLLRSIEDQIKVTHVLGDVFLPLGDWAMEPGSIARILSSIQVDDFLLDPIA